MFGSVTFLLFRLNASGFGICKNADSFSPVESFYLIMEDIYISYTL